MSCLVKDDADWPRTVRRILFTSPALVIKPVLDKLHAQTAFEFCASIDVVGSLHPSILAVRKHPPFGLDGGTLGDLLSTKP
jgi:hypothetical protein